MRALAFRPDRQAPPRDNTPDRIADILDLVGNRPRRVAHRIDDGVGQPCQRHARRMDHVALRIPFAGDCFGKFVCRRVQRAPRRRFNRFPVEQDRTALTDMRGFVEPLAQIRPQGVAHRFNRVQRLVFEYLGKYVAHQVIVIVRRNNGGTKPVGRLNAIVISAAGAYQNSPAPDIRPPLSESEKLSQTCG